MSEPFGDTVAEETIVEGNVPQPFGGDNNPETEPDTFEAPDDTVAGQADDDGNATTEPRRLAVDEYGDALVPVKINGEEKWVPLSEATNGYQRQEVFTRGQQETAAARALQQALESNPQATIELLQRQYGGAQNQEPEPQDFGALDPSDPLAKEVMELRQWQLNQVLDSELGRLSQKYADYGYNEQELLAAAQRRGINHASELEEVFQLMKFEEMSAKAFAQGSVSAANAQEVARRAAAAEAAQASIGSGNGVAASSAGTAPATFDTIEEAWNAAKLSTGFSGF